jgi:hypothetical protein
VVTGLLKISNTGFFHRPIINGCFYAHLFTIQKKLLSHPLTIPVRKAKGLTKESIGSPMTVKKASKKLQKSKERSRQSNIRYLKDEDA